MKYGYVVRIGHCFYVIDGGKEAKITKDIDRAKFFTKKKDAIETANRYGGRPFEVKLDGIGKDEEEPYTSDSKEEEKYIYILRISVVGNSDKELCMHKTFSGKINLDGSGVDFALSHENFQFTDEEVESYPDYIKNQFKACIKERVL